MAFVTWDGRFEVGVSIIDSQHRALFEHVNRLHDAMLGGHANDEIGRTLAFLARYTIDHFRTEEDLMRRTSYPGYRAHKAIHDDLTRQVAELQTKHGRGSQVLSLSVMPFLRDWLAHHISQEDLKMAVHLRASGVK